MDDQTQPRRVAYDLVTGLEAPVPEEDPIDDPVQPSHVTYEADLEQLARDLDEIETLIQARRFATADLNQIYALFARSDRTLTRAIPNPFFSLREKRAVLSARREYLMALIQYKNPNDMFLRVALTTSRIALKNKNSQYVKLYWKIRTLGLIKWLSQRPRRIRFKLNSPPHNPNKPLALLLVAIVVNLVFGILLNKPDDLIAIYDPRILADWLQRSIQFPYILGPAAFGAYCAAVLFAYLRGYPHHSIALVATALFMPAAYMGFVLVETPDHHRRLFADFIGPFGWTLLLAVLLEPAYMRIAPNLKRLISAKTPAPAAPSAPTTPVSNLPAVLPIPVEPALTASEQGVQLKLKRSQRTSNFGTIIFMLDARVSVTREDHALIEKHKLSALVVYDSKARTQHVENAQQHFESTRERSYSMSPSGMAWGAAKTLWRLGRASTSTAMAALSLRITVGSLLQGVHIECKDMNELLEGEEAIRTAAQNIKQYLATVATFDGREELIEL